MGDSETVNREVCSERHKFVELKFEEHDADIKSIKDAQKEYNNTLKNIYYLLLIIGFSTIMTLLGVILGRAIDFQIPL